MPLMHGLVITPFDAAAILIVLPAVLVYLDQHKNTNVVVRRHPATGGAIRVLVHRCAVQD